jgi:hypothetical protein
VTIAQTAESSTVTQGTETNTYAATQTHDGTYYDVTDSGAGAGIDFYLQFDIGEGASPVEFHLHGYYDEGVGATNSLYIQAYNFNTSTWVTMETLSNATADENHDIGLDTSMKNNDNEVRIGFLQDTQEANSVMKIDHCTVNYVNGALTAAAIQAEMEENGASILDTIRDKLPDDYIMGSSVTTSMDDEINDILTAQTQVLNDYNESGDPSVVGTSSARGVTPQVGN